MTIVIVAIASIATTIWTIKQCDDYEMRIKALENEVHNLRNYGTTKIYKQEK